MNHSSHHCSSDNHRAPRLNRRLLLTLSLLFGVFLISLLPFLSSLNDAIWSYLSIIWWAVLLGLLVGGIIDYFVPSTVVYKFLGKTGIRSILYSVVAGFMLSACSHGILAIAIELYKKGASTSSVVAFLLASPWANFPITILLFSFFGTQAFLIIAAAIGIAITTGLIFQKLEQLELVEPALAISPNEHVTWQNAKELSWANSVKGVYHGIIRLANMVLWWIIIGFLIAVLIKAYLPHHIIGEYLDASLSGLGLTLLIATVIEVCSEGSAPIAFEIYQQMGKIGNPFVFLMAGVVTDYTEIGLLWSNIGKRTAIWLPIITVPQVMLLGYLFNQYA